MSESSDPNLPRSQSLREPQGQHQRSSSHLHVTYSLRDSDARSNNNTSNSSNDNSSSSKNNNNRRKSILPSEGSDVSTTNAERKSIRFQTHKLSQSFRNNPQSQSSSSITRRTSNPESGIPRREDSNDDDRRDSKIQVFVDNMLRKRKSTLTPEGNEKGSRRQWVVEAFRFSLLSLNVCIMWKQMKWSSLIVKTWKTIRKLVRKVWCDCLVFLVILCYTLCAFEINQN